jgi:hypothetical protein
MYRPYESAVHGQCTTHSVPLTLKVMVSSMYQQIVKQVGPASLADLFEGRVSAEGTLGKIREARPRGSGGAAAAGLTGLRVMVCCPNISDHDCQLSNRDLM